MCQRLSRPLLLRRKVIGYRVYEVTTCSKPISFYGKNPAPPIDYEAQCFFPGQPFHAFTSLRSMRIWFYTSCFVHHSLLVVHRVRLRGKIRKGYWKGRLAVPTYTAQYCTTLGKVDEPFNLLTPQPLNPNGV